MPRPMLLETRTRDGRTIYVAHDDRTLSKIGDSVMSTYHKELLTRLGYFEGKDLLEARVEQTYEWYPEERFLEVTERIPLPERADPEPLGVVDDDRDRAAPTTD